ncbi:MAG TPA: macro domain-containing protein [Capsulimonadaceae bacterium]|jgi:O-acetyl-ADP-ribose deacetylase (regulator of RNase III)
MQSITINNTTLELYEGDITELDVDAVVNAANSALAGGGGVDGAIHRAAGRSLYDETAAIIARIGRLATGKAVTTGAGDMLAKYIIHTVGPIYSGSPADRSRLRDCYANSLAEVDVHGAVSVAFPAISTGVYRYPLAEAADVAVGACIEYVESHPDTCIEQIIFALYGRAAVTEYERVFGSKQ